MRKSTTLRSQILALARRKGVFKAPEIREALERRVSRQHVTSILRRLVEEGILVRSGTTRGATYAVQAKAVKLGANVRRRFTNRRLAEDEVFDEFRRAAPFIDRLPRQVREIYAYAFLEMLNNAIEHSRSQTIDTLVSRDRDAVAFEIVDHGVGVFRNVMKRRRLASELEAIQDLLKGKTTTQPEGHSGEGIFFTSKAADEFVLESFQYRLRVDNRIDDYFIERITRPKPGTRVRFQISAATSRRLVDVFRRYTVHPGEPGFDRSEVRVKLYRLGSQFISRSQARRLLAGLEKFKSVVVDFEGVDTIGQGFADEVFRVFRRLHPEIEITPVKMNDIVTLMVERARQT